MDLMKSSTSFSVLSKKYEGFSAPTVRIKVDGTEITRKLGARVNGVSVDLTSGFEASGCAFDVLTEYRAENTAFDSRGPFRLLQLGAKVELDLGYVKTETVFVGLIAEVEYLLGDEDAPYIHVECMDAKFLLMKQRRLQLYSNQKLSQVVSALLSEQPFSTYTTGRQVETLTRKYEMIPLSQEDDYRFIVRCAGYAGYEFFLIQGKAYFRKRPSLGAAILSLSPQNGLTGAKVSLRGSGLFKKAVVKGVNPQNDKAVAGTGSVSGKFSGGSTASRMMGQTTRTVFDASVTSAKEAADRARAIAEEALNSFGMIECRCIGLPELVPGRTVKLTGLLPEGDRTVYLTTVRHTLEEDHYHTEFEGRFGQL